MFLAVGWQALSDVSSERTVEEKYRFVDGMAKRMEEAAAAVDVR